MHELFFQGTPLSFVDAGKGAPPLVMVHDVGCDLSSFLPQLEYFSLSHRVAAVDLRGHGRSGGGSVACGISGLAEDLSWLCYELGLYRPVLVGHGIGGLVCIEMAAIHPDLPSAIVALGAPVFLPLKSREFVESFLLFAAGLPEPAFRAALRAVLRNFLPRQSADRYVDSVLWGASRVSRQVAVSVWRDALKWDGSRTLVASEVPLLYVDSGTGITDPATLEALCPSIRTLRLSSGGHFAHLEQPERINLAIEEFLRDVLPRL